MVTNLIMLATFGEVMKWICCGQGLVCIILFIAFRNGNKERRQFNDKINNSIAGRVVSTAIGQEMMQEDPEEKWGELILGILALAGATAIIFWVIIPFWHIIGWFVAGIFGVLYFVVKANGNGCLAWIMLALALFAVLSIFVPISELI